MDYPDPIVSANIYAAGSLDQAIRRGLVPFRRELRQLYPDTDLYFWAMRYGCSGEHLKVRVHGPQSESEALRELLGESMERALLGLQADSDPESGSPSPPIDVEDEEKTHADRSWCWTTYRRHHISLGSKPFLLDDGYVARFTRCLGAACEVVVEALAPEAEGVAQHMVRHNTMTQLLVDGLAVLGFDDSQRCDYLDYHRDWLIRFPLLRSGGTAAQVHEIVGRFEQIRGQMAEELETLGHLLAHSEWEKAKVESDLWRSTLVDLWNYTAVLCEDPAYRVDPFASAPIFTPLFKLFHCTANQLGLSRLEEALVHHLLVRAVRPEEPVRIEVLFEPSVHAPDP